MVENNFWVDSKNWTDNWRKDEKRGARSLQGGQGVGFRVYHKKDGREAFVKIIKKIKNKSKQTTG